MRAETPAHWPATEAMEARRDQKFSATIPNKGLAGSSPIEHPPAPSWSAIRHRTLCLTCMVDLLIASAVNELKPTDTTSIPQ